MKDIPHSATSYTVSLDKLKQGVSYEFRVVAVNEFGYGEPSTPSTAISGNHVFCIIPSPLGFLYKGKRRDPFVHKAVRACTISLLCQHCPVEIGLMLK